jgi:LacI family transcriptional regulator
MAQRMGPKPITQRDIAARCGVSQMAVSLALRGDPGVSAETIAHVRAVAAEMGYDPSLHEAARRMALRKHGREVRNHVIGLLFPIVDMLDGYHAAIFGGLVRGVTVTGNGLLSAFLPPIGDPAHYRLPVSANRGEVDSVITLLPTAGVEPLIAQLRAIAGFGDRPVVSLVWPVADGSSIVPDYAHGAYQATAHLLALGHRHLLHFIHDNPDRYLWGYPQDARLAGVRRALEDAGLDPARHLTTTTFDNAWLDPHELVRPTPEADAALLGLLQHRPEITALLGWNDAVAIRAARALQAAGRRVPEDYSLVGFDDTDALRDTLGQNMLTSVGLPLASLGREAVTLAVQRTEGTVSEDVMRMLPTTLVLRQSTGVARGARCAGQPHYSASGS